MELNPWLSVIVPVFNGERYLARALQSVLSQIDDRTEVIVSDDGSSDRSVLIAEDFSARYGAILMRGPGQGNWVANSNHAAKRARGQLLTFLHQDDLWLPERMVTIRRIVEAQPSRSIWVGPSWFIDSGGQRVGTWNLPFRQTGGSVDPYSFLEHLLVQNFVAMPAPVFPRTAFERAGGMDENLWFTAGWDLWLKLGGQNGAGLFPTATTAFRLHWQSQTMTGAAEHESMRKQIDTVRSRYVDRLPNLELRRRVDQAGRLSCEVNSSLAALVSGQPLPWRRLLTAVHGAGLDGYRRFLRDARLFERSAARLRIAIGTQPGGAAPESMSL